jgi:hypothetical protein
MYVARVDDHAVVAEASVGGSTYEWASADGKTWTRLKGTPVDEPDPSEILVGRDRGMITSDWLDADTGWPNFPCFDASFNLKTLAQTGSFMD